MSDPEPISSSEGLTGDAPSAVSTAHPPDVSSAKGTRRQVAVHRLDGGLEQGESDARSLTGEGFPIYTPPDLDRARWIPVRDIKYVVFGSVDDPDLEATAERQGDEHTHQHVGADQRAERRVAQVEPRHQVRAQGGDGLKLIAECDPGDRQGHENKPRPHDCPFPQWLSRRRAGRCDAILREWA